MLRSKEEPSLGNKTKGEIPKASDVPCLPADEAQALLFELMQGSGLFGITHENQGTLDKPRHFKRLSEDKDD